MPGIGDPRFERTVTYLCEHGENGAMGLVVNQPTDLQLKDVLHHIDIMDVSPTVADQAVYQGGPVQTERGFVLHQPYSSWESTLQITDRIGLTTSRDILEALAAGEGPERSLVALGYAGWEAGQLEDELLDNAWLSGPADPNVLFDTPIAERWHVAAGLLGVDTDKLTIDAGHA